MPTYNEEWQEIENQFIAIRFQLRKLRGKVAGFSQVSHPNELNRSTTAVDQTAKLLNNKILTALAILDQYEIYKEHFYEQEAGYERILELLSPFYDQMNIS